MSVCWPSQHASRRPRRALRARGLRRDGGVAAVAARRPLRAARVLHVRARWLGHRGPRPGVGRAGPGAAHAGRWTAAPTRAAARHRTRARRGPHRRDEPRPPPGAAAPHRRGPRARGTGRSQHGVPARGRRHAARSDAEAAADIPVLRRKLAAVLRLDDVVPGTRRADVGVAVPGAAARRAVRGRHRLAARRCSTCCSPPSTRIPSRSSCVPTPPAARCRCCWCCPTTATPGRCGNASSSTCCRSSTGTRSTSRCRSATAPRRWCGSSSTSATGRVGAVRLARRRGPRGPPAVPHVGGPGARGAAGCARPAPGAGQLYAPAGAAPALAVPVGHRPPRRRSGCRGLWRGGVGGARGRRPLRRHARRARRRPVPGVRLGGARRRPTSCRSSRASACGSSVRSAGRSKVAGCTSTSSRSASTAGSRPWHLIDAATAGRLARGVAALATGEADVDSLNRLAVTGGLDVADVSLVRAYRRYRRQVDRPLLGREGQRRARRQPRRGACAARVVPHPLRSRGRRGRRAGARAAAYAACDRSPRSTTTASCGVSPAPSTPPCGPTATCVPRARSRSSSTARPCPT